MGFVADPLSSFKNQGAGPESGLCDVFLCRNQGWTKPLLRWIAIGSTKRRPVAAVNKAPFGSARYEGKLGGFSSIGISGTGRVFDRSGTGVQYADTKVRLQYFGLEAGIARLVLGISTSPSPRQHHHAPQDRSPQNRVHGQR
jgi:hypothetical protein